MDIKEKLKEWGFEQLTQAFTGNGITLEVLKICTIEDISSLLCRLNLGSKIIFKRRLEEFQKGAVLMKARSEAPINVANANIPSCSRKYSTLSASTSKTSDETSLTSPPTTSFPNRIPTCKSPKKKFRNNDYLDYEDFKTNLNENVYGRIITSFYEKTGCLDKSHRNKLAKLILSLELEDNIGKCLSSERFLQLSYAIVKLFPTEKKETWYTPYQNVGNERKVNARGKLIDLYHNKRRKLIQSGIISSKRRVGKCSTPNAHETVDESEKSVCLSTTAVPFEIASSPYRKETIELQNKQFYENNQETGSKLTETEIESENVLVPFIVIKQESVESTVELLPPFPEISLPGPELNSTNVDETPVTNEPERKRKMSIVNPDVVDSTSSATQDKLSQRPKQPLLSKRSKLQSPCGAKKFAGRSIPPNEDTQNATRELFQSLINGSEINSLSGSRTDEIPRDIFDVLANYISEKLRQMNWDQCALNLKAILDILSQPHQVQQSSGEEDSDIFDPGSSRSSSSDQE